MKLLAIQTILFIIKKWDYEIQETLTPTGKIFLFLPWFINPVKENYDIFSVVDEFDKNVIFKLIYRFN